MNKHVLAAALTAATLFTGHAFAGVYVGIAGGITDAGDIASNLKTEQESFAADVGVPFVVSEKTEDDDKSVKGFIGYAFNKNFALELSYSDLGKISSKLGTIDNPNPPSVALGQFDEAEITAVTLDAVATLPVTDKFSAFVKAGITKTKIDYSYAWVAIDGNMNLLDGELGGNSFKETGLHYGVGAGYDITESLNLFAEYEVYQVKDGANFDEDLRALNAGLKFKF